MNKYSHGFTLVELMVTITVAAILIGVAVPSLTSVYEGIRANNNAENVLNLMSFARNQAVSYGTTVSVCARASDTSCKSSNDWQDGIRVFAVDRDNKEVELRTINSFNSQDDISGPSSIITFSPDGLSSGGEIIYCPGGKSSNSKSISILTSGKVTFGTDGKSC
ncbi:GspH/FimT family pseudopilin [Shewanella aestuarii]|uniref:Type II secretion system protein H n=1 Tax=Shewanella aestuarii TaxID=1028752 RepID=A0A6G9QMA6_9GAMM|nr:GspH/FimT family pseudopilin [Shewanella aestuarii]QIR15195.1 prepilin-type N-terminal cleavage/methylation domain-containing protein [Shewanella aestuarii]